MQLQPLDIISQWSSKNCCGKKLTNCCFLRSSRSSSKLVTSTSLSVCIKADIRACPPVSWAENKNKSLVEHKIYIVIRKLTIVFAPSSQIKPSFVTVLIFPPALLSASNNVTFKPWDFSLHAAASPLQPKKSNPQISSHTNETRIGYKTENRTNLEQSIKRKIFLATENSTKLPPKKKLTSRIPCLHCPSQTTNRPKIIKIQSKPIPDASTNNSNLLSLSITWTLANQNHNHYQNISFCKMPHILQSSMWQRHFIQAPASKPIWERLACMTTSILTNPWINPISVWPLKIIQQYQKLTIKNQSSKLSPLPN